MTFFVFFLLVFYDWFLGSWISAELQKYPVYDQSISDAYQLGFFFFVLLSALTVYLSRLVLDFEFRRVFWAVFILLAGYTEDVAFYLLLRLFNPFGFQLPEGILPDQISGWIGWSFRMFGVSVALPQELVLVLATSAFWLAIFVLSRSPHEPFYTARLKFRQVQKQ